MIDIKTLVSDLQDKLNNNIQGLDFVLSLDTAKFKRSLRVQNTVTERINGLVKVTSSDLTTLPGGKIFATMSCNLKVIFKLEGKEEDSDIRNDENEVVGVLPGYKHKIDTVRLALTTAFQNNEQVSMTEVENGVTREFLVLKLYQFPESGERLQVQELGDSYSFNVYISYMFVEGGISSYDVVYSLGGNIIPFETNTAYRTPTMDGNVYADTVDGAVKNLVSQTTFSVSFQLPALKNAVTRQMFKYLFNGKINQAHILSVKYPSFNGGEDEEYFYLVTFGETNAIGNTILNVGQSLTLMESVDDYELLNFPSNYSIYQLDYAIDDYFPMYFERDAVVYNATTKQFIKIEQGFPLTTTAFPISVGDKIISTSPLSDINGFPFVTFSILQRGE